MSFEAIYNISQAEAEGKAAVAAAEQKAKALIAEAEAAGKAAVESAIARAEDELKELRVKAGEKPYAFIEIMACPGGCVNGGGQPIVSAETKMDVDVRVERAKALYGEDRAKPLRKSHNNSEIKLIYDDYLTKPGSHLAHELLHTHYNARPLYTKAEK